MSSDLAILGGTPVRDEPINANTIAVDDDLTRAVLDLLEHHPLSDFYGGANVLRFEEAFARYHGPAFAAVAVNSGTSALHLALTVGGVGPGDEVIVPAFCFVAAATAVVQVGAIPVVADVEAESLTLDPKSVTGLIGPGTRAVLAVHYWGLPADVVSLRRLCDQHGLVLIEDTAQAPGGTVAGAKTGTFGEFATFSFAMRKHITCGEGGMVLTTSAKDAQRVKSLANVGKGPGWDEYRTTGYSYRMVEVSALIGLHGLRRLDREISARRAAAAVYRDVLRGSGLTLVQSPPWGESVYFKQPILLPDGWDGDRSFLVDAVSAENVSCKIPHRPLYEVPWLAEHLRERGRYRGPEECPIAANARPRLFEVETGPHLPRDEAAKSAHAVEKVWHHVVGQ